MVLASESSTAPGALIGLHYQIYADPKERSKIILCHRASQTVKGATFYGSRYLRVPHSSVAALRKTCSAFMFPSHSALSV